MFALKKSQAWKISPKELDCGLDGFACFASDKIGIYYCTDLFS
jgi:hypothetical protein